MTKTGNATLTIRIGKKQRQSWKSKAANAGMSLSSLVRYVMDHTDVEVLMVAKRNEKDKATKGQIESAVQEVLYGD